MQHIVYMVLSKTNFISCLQRSTTWYLDRVLVYFLHWRGDHSHVDGRIGGWGCGWVWVDALHAVVVVVVDDDVDDDEMLILVLMLMLVLRWVVGWLVGWLVSWSMDIITVALKEEQANCSRPAPQESECDWRQYRETFHGNQCGASGMAQIKRSMHLRTRFGILKSVPHGFWITNSASDRTLNFSASDKLRTFWSFLGVGSGRKEGRKKLTLFLAAHLRSKMMLFLFG